MEFQPIPLLSLIFFFLNLQLLQPEVTAANVVAYLKDSINIVSTQTTVHNNLHHFTRSSLLLNSHGQLLGLNGTEILLKLTRRTRNGIILLQIP